MRGQQKNIKSLKISGNVFLKHWHQDEIAKAQTGDIYLYIHNEEELHLVILNEYSIKGYKGYFKAKIYDGRDWCMLDNLDFFEDKINQFTKGDISLYTYNLCYERMISFKDTEVYRTYREHYSLEKHVQGEYKGKKSIRKN